MRFKNFLRFIWEDIKDIYENNKVVFILTFIITLSLGSHLILYYFINPEIAFKVLKVLAACFLVSTIVIWCIIFYFYLKNKWEMS